MPDDPTLRAFSDRFALRLEIEPIPDESLGDMLEKGWDLELERINRSVTQGEALLDPAQLELLYQELAHIGVGGVLSQYQEVIRRLRAEGVRLTERRMVKGLKLIRGAALLDGRSEADVRDLWPLNHVWNTPEDVPILRQVVQPLVEEAGGPALDTHRRLEDLVEELELLESRAPALTGEGAFTAHLSALAQIRRELLLYHVDAKALLQRVERLIQQQLEAMRAVG